MDCETTDATLAPLPRSAACYLLPRQAAALRSLPYLLSRASKIICLIDGEYFKRLWCMYELATYTQVRPSGKVVQGEAV